MEKIKKNRLEAFWRDFEEGKFINSFPAVMGGIRKHYHSNL